MAFADNNVIAFDGWRVPPDFQSDGCTLAKDGRWSDACVLHDFLRRHAIVPVAEADALLYRHMRALGAGRLRARLYWLGARMTSVIFTRTLPLPAEWVEYGKPI